MYPSFPTLSAFLDTAYTQGAGPAAPARTPALRRFSSLPGQGRARDGRNWSVPLPVLPRTYVSAVSRGPARRLSIEDWPALPRGTPPGKPPAPAARATCGVADHDWSNGTVPPGFKMGYAAYRDLNGTLRHPHGRVRHTESVWAAGQVLTEARWAPITVQSNLPIVAYFNLLVEAGNGQAAGLPLAPADPAWTYVQQAMVDTALELRRLDASPTLRQLVRVAVEQGRLPVSGPGRWVAKVACPAGCADLGRAIGPPDGPQAAFKDPFLPDHACRVVTLPLPGSEPPGNRYYLSRAGESEEIALRQMSARACTVRALVCTLLGARPAGPERWVGTDGLIDPQRVVIFGMGERGAVDYLAQRILRELQPDAPVWLSPIPFGIDNLVTPPGKKWPEARLNDAMQAAIAANGGLQAVARYVAAQDEYLQEHYPSGWA
ncbi:hypothetical protein [Bordetella bronchialis]|uniref:Uncharacterized protein n=1 Tax=Bordetella bronchialis TaxID=463025 RepID=A0A193FSG4_9BORD|nr:hypothetical protein [Bordetella bronchialis]ANN70697.1 hypothetical protein BAU08_04560 [Bordetella bronchialis]